MRMLQLYYCQLGSLGRIFCDWELESDFFYIFNFLRGLAVRLRRRAAAATAGLLLAAALPSAGGAALLARADLCAYTE